MPRYFSRMKSSLVSSASRRTGWPSPRVVAGPVRVIRADVVGNGHVRTIVAGEDGGSLKAMAFRAADTALGQALLGAPPHRRLWLAGRARVDAPGWLVDHQH